MRVLIISDIHANLTAFEAVLQDAKGEWDVIWHLGDLVGYGPDPNEIHGSNLAFGDFQGPGRWSPLIQ